MISFWKSDQLLFYLAHWDISQPLIAHSYCMSLCAYRNMQSCPRQRAFHTKRGVKVKSTLLSALFTKLLQLMKNWWSVMIISGKHINHFIVSGMQTNEQYRSHPLLYMCEIFLKNKMVTLYNKTLYFNIAKCNLLI